MLRELTYEKEADMSVLVYTACVALVLACSVTDAGTYRAAVYEHKVIFPWPWAKNRHMALSQMMVNMKSFQQQAHIAGKQVSMF